MLRLLTAGESHGKGLVGILEGLPAGVPVSPKEVARRARAAPDGPRAERPAEARGRPRRDPLGRAPRPDARRPDRGHDRERRVGVQVPRAHGRRGRDRSRGQAHAAAARPRRSRRSAEVRVRRRAQRARARERARDRGARGARRRRKAFLAELGIQVLSHVVRIGSVAARAPSGARARRTSTPSTRRPCAASTTPRPARMVAEIDADPQGRATRSAACSRCSRTGARRGSARTCSTTASSTRGSRSRS